VRLRKMIQKKGRPERSITAAPARKEATIGTGFLRNPSPAPTQPSSSAAIRILALADACIRLIHRANGARNTPRRACANGRAAPPDKSNKGLKA